MGVEYTKRLLFELQFKFTDGISYGYREPYWWLADGTKYYWFGSGSLTSGYVNLRANYFVNEKRRENPVYFIGSLNLGFQNVTNSETKESPDGAYITNSHFSRFVIGPEAGLGIYFDLGVFNFAFESTFCSRMSFDKGYKKYTENSITVKFSPVIKL
jgi:hypothetical protein